MKANVLLGGFAESMFKLMKGMSKDKGLYQRPFKLHDECDDIGMEGLQKFYTLTRTKLRMLEKMMMRGVGK